MTPNIRILMSLLISFLTKFQLTSTVTGPDITDRAYNAKHKHVVMIYVIGKDRNTGRVQKSWCTAGAIQFGGKLFLLTAAQCVYDHFVQFDCAARCLCILTGAVNLHPSDDAMEAGAMCFRDFHYTTDRNRMELVFKKRSLQTLQFGQEAAAILPDEYKANAEQLRNLVEQGAPTLEMYKRMGAMDSLNLAIVDFQATICYHKLVDAIGDRVVVLTEADFQLLEPPRPQQFVTLVGYGQYRNDLNTKGTLRGHGSWRVMAGASRRSSNLEQCVTMEIGDEVLAIGVAEYYRTLFEAGLLTLYKMGTISRSDDISYVESMDIGAPAHRNEHKIPTRLFFGIHVRRYPSTLTNNDYDNGVDACGFLISLEARADWLSQWLRRFLDGSAYHN